MAGPVAQFTDPVGEIMNIATVSGVQNAGGAALGAASDVRVSLLPAVQLMAKPSAAATIPAMVAIANAGNLEASASALVTFPAIYKAYTESGGVIAPPRYPVMREYPPVIR